MLLSKLHIIMFVSSKTSYIFILTNKFLVLHVDLIVVVFIFTEVLNLTISVKSMFK